MTENAASPADGGRRPSRPGAHRAPAEADHDPSPAGTDDLGSARADAADLGLSSAATDQARAATDQARAATDPARAAAAGDSVSAGAAYGRARVAEVGGSAIGGRSAAAVDRAGDRDAGEHLGGQEAGELFGGLDLVEVERIVYTALAEDLGDPPRDVTSEATIPAGQVDVAEIVARAPGVVAGLPVAAQVFAAASGGTAGFDRLVEEGARVARGDVLAVVAGPTRALLTAERTALNLLCRMSGVATHTRKWADALAGTKATVLDTRKTTPGLRALEKYAVRAGGGTNKRMGLYDVAMIKDNHKLAAGGITAAYRLVRATFPDVPVQVEVTTVAEAEESVEAGADFLLCDNMSPELLREVVRVVADRAELEATGNLTLETVAAYAATGVDYLSVGGLTHSSPILDIAMDLRSR
jgi:nicotinate-nucleotide pyrophosphorylase (carboxylating)